MSDEKTNRGEGSGSISAGRDIVGHEVAGRDIVHGDVVGGDKVGRDKITMGDVNIHQTFVQWQTQMERAIDAAPNLSSADKQDAKETVAKIQTEAAKGEHADAGRLEKLLNTLAVMGPDILDVAITTLGNPLAGIGLVVKKIADKAKVERA